MELLQLENIITAKLKVMVPRLTNGKYPHMSFTNEISEQTPSFPNVYIHELEPSEVGRDLANDQIHALRDTIQIDVSTNTGKNDARIVVNACIRAMKSLKFSLVSGPTHIKVNNINRFVIRVRRIVANGDEL